MLAPKIPSFFKNKKPNQFHFEPRYYSERKEKMEERYKRIERELEKEKSTTSDSTSFRTNLRDNWESQRRRSSGLNYRMMIYIVVMFALAYYYLFR